MASGEVTGCCAVCANRTHQATAPRYGLDDLFLRGDSRPWACSPASGWIRSLFGEGHWSAAYCFRLLSRPSRRVTPAAAAPSRHAPKPGCRSTIYGTHLGLIAESFLGLESDNEIGGTFDAELAQRCGCQA